MQEKGYNSVAVAPYDKYTEKLQKECSFIRLNNLDRKSRNLLTEFKLLKELYVLFKQHKPDLALLFTVKPNTYGSVAGKITKTKTICNITGLGYLFINKSILKTTIIDNLFRIAFKNPIRFFFQNFEDRNLFVDKFNIEKCLTEITPGSGVNLERFSYVKAENREACSFLLIARLLKDKGILEYIEATKIVSEKVKNVEFILVGSPDEGNPATIKEKDLQEYIRHNKSLKYIPEVDDVKSFLTNSSVLVLPSYREGTPRTNLEAMAVGRPIITTDVPGCRNTVENGKNGILVPAKDSIALAKAMLKFIKLPFKKKVEMGKYSRQKAENEFDEKIIIDKYLKIIKEVLGCCENIPMKQ
jgi:glycosyltransferase involved in cell wall biosynthesis